MTWISLEQLLKLNTVVWLYDGRALLRTEPPRSPEQGLR